MSYFEGNVLRQTHRKITMAAAGVIVLATILGVIVPTRAASPELVNRAVEAGINYSSTPSWDVCTTDFNGDGTDDFLANLHMKNAGALFANNNSGTFTKIPTNTVSPRPSPEGNLVDRHACAWADVDGNGLMDLYNSAGRWASNKYKDESINNELYLQTAPGVFVDVATQAGVDEPCGRNRHVVFADFSGDGLPDMFVGAQKERADSADVCNGRADYPYIEQSKVYVNNGNSESGNWLGFRRAPEFDVSQDNSGSRAAIAWDENGDGLMDLITLPFANKTPYFYRNTGSGFMEMSRSGLKKFPVMNGFKVGDITGDGIVDLVFADNNGFAYRRGTATGVSTTTVRLGANVASNADGWTVALGDINGDGKTDVYGLAAGTSGNNPDDIVYVAQATTGFRAYIAPSAGGDGNDVEAVRVNGRAQFVVLNGGNDETEAPGPIQLIAWR